MTLQQLDFIFPFIAFGYGLIMVAILYSPFFVKLGQTRLPAEVWSQFQAKRTLAWVCFFVGGIWSLQNLWLD